MTSLLDYEFLMHDVFYRCWHILEYIEKHPGMPTLDREAIKATIMDALVYKDLIDPTKESLDLENMCIRDNLDYYRYEKHPDVCGIPQWMKEAFRHKIIVISGSIPVSMFLSHPPDKISRYCVYDPNTAVSSIFPDAIFYEVFYTSPTRGIRIESKRPFVEVEIDGIPYLVDILTKRIFKSSFFKETYGFEIVSEMQVSKFDEETKEKYQDLISERNGLGGYIPLFEPMVQNFSKYPSMAELLYEFERAKEIYPESLAEAEELKLAMMGDNADFMKYVSKRMKETKK